MAIALLVVLLSSLHLRCELCCYDMQSFYSSKRRLECERSMCPRLLCTVCIHTVPVVYHVKVKHLRLRLHCTHRQ